MSYKLTDIAHEQGQYFVLDVGAKGFEIYKTGVTHATRCASIGRSLGVSRCITEINRRETLDAAEGRRYHILAINERTGVRDYITGYPMSHKQCMTMISKQSQHSARRFQLEEYTG